MSSLLRNALGFVFTLACGWLCAELLQLSAVTQPVRLITGLVILAFAVPAAYCAVYYGSLGGMPGFGVMLSGSRWMVHAIVVGVFGALAVVVFDPPELPVYRQIAGVLVGVVCLPVALAIMGRKPQTRHTASARAYVLVQRLEDGSYTVSMRGGFVRLFGSGDEAYTALARETIARLEAYLRGDTAFDGCIREYEAAMCTVAADGTVEVDGLPGVWRGRVDGVLEV